MSDSELTVFLEHHGVKGQKWGVRQARKESVGKARVQLETTHREVQKAKAAYSEAKKAGKGEEAALIALKKAQYERVANIRDAGKTKTGKGTAAIVLGTGLAGVGIGVFTYPAWRLGVKAVAKSRKKSLESAGIKVS